MGTGPTRRAREGDITIVIERRDRRDIAELLLDEARKLEADARGRRRNSPARVSLFEQSGPSARVVSQDQAMSDQPDVIIHFPKPPSEEQTVLSSPVNGVFCPLAPIARLTKQLNIFHVIGPATYQRHDMIPMVFCSELYSARRVGAFTFLYLEQTQNVSGGMPSGGLETTRATVGDNGSGLIWIVNTPFLFYGFTPFQGYQQPIWRCGLWLVLDVFFSSHLSVLYSFLCFLHIGACHASARNRYRLCSLCNVR